MAKGGGRPGARAAATTTPGQPRAARPQRSTSRRAPTTGRGAAARAAERSTLGAASGRHGWRTASRREGAGAGTAIAQHHAGTGGRAGGWNSRPAASRRQRSGAGHTGPAATCLRERARQAPAPTHPANAQRTAARWQTRPSRARPSGPQPTQLPPNAADDQAECFPICYRPAGRRLCHKRDIHIQFGHRNGVRQSGWPRDWPDTRRGFLSGVKVPATQCDRIELPMAAVTRPLLPGCTPTGAPMAKGLRMQTSRVA